uniref:Uncharacterized protein n=1 Tax=Arundo donax TaxID=35708 RepID=A0A0A9HUT9_ARUDO
MQIFGHYQIAVLLFGDHKSALASGSIIKGVVLHPGVKIYSENRWF